jgi:uncharacterized protein (DUF885 family)
MVKMRYFAFAFLALSAFIANIACISLKAKQRPADLLAKIDADYHTFTLQQNPFYATALGEKGYNQLVPDLSEENDSRAHLELGKIRERLLNIDRNSLSEDEQIHRAALYHQIDSLFAEEVCQFSLWSVDQLSGPQLALADALRRQPIANEAELADLLQRLKNAKTYYSQYIKNLRTGQKLGLSAPQPIIKAVIGQIEAQLKEKPQDSAYMVSVDRLPKSWSQAQITQAQAQILHEIDKNIYPNLRALKNYLASELLPHARISVGLSALPFGATCYANLIYGYIDLNMSAAEIHDLGLKEVDKIHSSMRKLVNTNTNFKTTKDYINLLKNDPAQYMTGREELLSLGIDLVKRAEAALPKAFKRLPKTPIVVIPIERFREKNAPAAYYEEAPIDQSHPAYYYLNLYDATKRPRYSLPALTFHEAVPGHHLQIALAQENPDLRRYGHQLPETAFVEGWALYAEILSRELGLYHGVDELFGSLNYELWRAMRLVVDTGIHLLGWSRKQAIDYMAENSALTKEEIINEVDRYIMMPAQALSYKIGQLTISELRASTELNLAQDFSLPDFHDQVLKRGAMPLQALRQTINKVYPPKYR